MSRIIDCGNIQVDVEKVSNDLALLFAESRLKERIRNHGDLSSEDAKLNTLAFLTESYYSAFSYLMTVPDERIKDLMES